MKNKIIIVSTTYGWNPGDDFIREGVFRLLDLPCENTIIYMNRLAVKKTGILKKHNLLKQIRKKMNQVISYIPWITRKRSIYFSDWKPLWSCQKNFPDLDDIFKYAELFIIAGTPEWINATEKAYNLCAKYNIPIIIIGVGQEWTNFQPIGLDPKHVKMATTRDLIALQRLKRFGITATMWPDPSIFSVKPNFRKKYDIILGYRSDVAKDQIYLNIYKRFKSRINLIVVNELTDFVKAKQLFDTYVYYNSDYRRMKDILSNANIYIGGRIHGALPCFASGGKAWLIYHNSKGELVSHLRNKMIDDGVDPSIALLTYENKSLNHINVDKLGNPEESVKWIEKKFYQYKSHIYEIIGDLLK